MSSAHHPQTDGASEVMIRMVENYLRCYFSLRKNDWDELFPAVELAYNSARSDELQASPFEVDVDWNSKSPFDLSIPIDSPVESSNEFKLRLDSALQDARFSYELEKVRNAAYTAQKYEAPSYSVGDQLWLNRSKFRDSICGVLKLDKLGSKRFGPFWILGLFGRNAVKLEFPDNMCLHPVVHVSHTRPLHYQPAHISQSVLSRPAAVPDADGAELFDVDQILSHRKHGRSFQWLTLLTVVLKHEATWHPTRDFFDVDGRVTKAFHDYIVANNLLPHLH